MKHKEKVASRRTRFEQEADLADTESTKPPMSLAELMKKKKNFVHSNTGLVMIRTEGASAPSSSHLAESSTTDPHRDGTESTPNRPGVTKIALKKEKDALNKTERTVHLVSVILLF